MTLTAPSTDRLTAHVDHLAEGIRDRQPTSTLESSIDYAAARCFSGLGVTTLVSPHCPNNPAVEPRAVKSGSGVTRGEVICYKAPPKSAFKATDARSRRPQLCVVLVVSRVGDTPDRWFDLKLNLADLPCIYSAIRATPMGVELRLGRVHVCSFQAN